MPVVADERQGEVDGLIWDEGACDRRSQWFGNPEAKEGSLCSIKSRPLYKIISYKNEKDDHTYQGDQAKDLLGRLLSRVKDVRVDKARNVRFFVLGYEIPWDEDDTLIRYGMRFYFIDTLTLGASASDPSAAKIEYLGYELDYANEATPQPFLAHNKKGGVPGKDEGPAARRPTCVPFQERKITECGRRKSATVGFEVVYTIFQGGDVCLESVNVLVEVNFIARFQQLMMKSGVTFCNPADVDSERFRYYAKMTFDLFQLLGIHGSHV